MFYCSPDWLNVYSLRGADRHTIEIQVKKKSEGTQNTQTLFSVVLKVINRENGSLANWDWIVLMSKMTIWRFLIFFFFPPPHGAGEQRLGKNGAEVKERWKERIKEMEWKRRPEGREEEEK